MEVYREIGKFSKILMLKEPFYGLFLSSINKEINNTIPTACVTVENINIKLCVNSKFWEGLDDDTKLGVLKHELLHIAFSHLSNYDRFSDKKLANIAADLEINQYISPEYKGPTWDGLEIDEFPYNLLNLLPNKGTKYYYDELGCEIKNNPGGEVAKHIEDLTQDIHPLWKVLDGMDEAEKKLILKQLEHQLKETAKGFSPDAYPPELSQLISNLFEITPPVINWKNYLRRFSNTSNKTTTSKTRNKINKRFRPNPALKFKPKKNTLVAIDTSGSVNNEELIEFFSEIHHIHKSGTKITVVECDTQINKTYEYTGIKKQLSVTGRGGTRFTPVIEYLNKHKFNNLIYFTDGEAPAPDVKTLKPILWVHSSVSSINDDLPGSKIRIN